MAGLGILLLGSRVALAEDWPQWLGPKRDSVWRESGILDRFPTNGPPVRWRTPVGGGYSGPSVAGGRVYVTDRQHAEGRSQERVLCLDEAKGRIVWRYEYDCPYSISFAAGPRAAPLISNGKVYTFGAEGNLLCLDAEKGTPVWSRDIKQELGVKAPTWGFAGHPCLRATG